MIASWAKYDNFLGHSCGIVLILLAQQIPHALHVFLHLEAGVDDNDDNVSGGSDDDEFSLLITPWIIFHGTKIHIDDLINNDKDPAGLDETSTQQQLSWTQLPDREDRFAQLLTDILEWSLNSRGRNLALHEATEHPDDALVQVRMPPTSHDFPLWHVACRVGLLNSLTDENL